MRNTAYKTQQSIGKSLVFACSWLLSVIVLNGCSDGQQNSDTIIIDQNKGSGSFEVPQALQSRALNQTEVKAWITFDDSQNPQKFEMSRSGDSVSFNGNLTPGTYTITITFTYSSGTATDLELARASQANVNLTVGSSTVTFAVEDYSYEDLDEDGYENIVELDQGTDPEDSASKPQTPCNIALGHIACGTPYSIGGNVSGLLGSGLLLKLNNQEQISVAPNAGADVAFTFSTQLADTSQYSVTVSQQPANPSQKCEVVNSSGTGVVGGADITSVSVQCSTNTYTIGGTVVGLQGSGMKLVNNGESIDVSPNGGADVAFSFPTKIASNGTYTVDVSVQPTNPNQSCNVSNGSGTVGASNISIIVNCQSNAYTVGGNVSGLAGTSGLQLTLGTETLTVTSNNTYAFRPLADGSAFSISISGQPQNPRQTCSFVNANNTGQLNGANIVNINIQCETNKYTVGGSISGLSGTGLVLRNNGANDLTVAANSTSFSFANITDGSSYSVSIAQQPKNPDQDCKITSGAPTGTVNGANVTNITIQCTSLYSVGGTVTGLLGKDLKLKNNNLEEITVAANVGNSVSFTFPTKLKPNNSYSITVSNQPNTPDQICEITNASGAGTISNSNITTVTINCNTLYSVGGSVTGLLAGSLKLKNNNQEEITVQPNASGGNLTFTFPTKLTPNTPYAVTVSAQPRSAALWCNVANGSGTISNRNVTTVSVNCTVPAPIAGAFPDSSLQTCINSLAATNGWTNAADITGTVDCSSRSPAISNLSGLEYLSNISGLDLSINTISNIEPLALLNNLTELKLDGNQLGNINVLSNLTQLTRLSIPNTGISSIAALTGLTQLSYLDLTGNNIVDIGPVTNLIQLTTFYAYGNKVINIAPLSNHPNLVELTLEYNQIADMSVLTNLPMLSTLKVTGNPIKNIKGISNLSQLAVLHLDNRFLTDADMPELAGLVNLVTFELAASPTGAITDISVLQNFPFLKFLNLTHNSISNIKPLSNLADLRTLRLSSNQVSDLSPLSALSRLTTLELDNNAIVDVSPLSNFQSLFTLTMINNKIGGQGVGHVDSLVNLLSTATRINLSGNKTMSCSELTTLINALNTGGTTVVTPTTASPTGAGQNCTAP